MIKMLKTFKQLHISQIIGGEIFKPQIINFSSVFAKHEPMPKVLKVSNKDASITLGTIINDETCNIYLATERTNYPLKNIKGIYGGILTMDLLRYMTLHFNNIPKVSYPIVKIVGELDDKNELYPDPNEAIGKALHIPALAVLELYSCQGLGITLYKVALYEGKKAGYKVVYNEATSFKSQNFQI